MSQGKNTNRFTVGGESPVGTYALPPVVNKVSMQASNGSKSVLTHIRALMSVNQSRQSNIVSKLKLPTLEQDRDRSSGRHQKGAPFFNKRNSSASDDKVKM